MDWHLRRSEKKHENDQFCFSQKKTQKLIPVIIELSTEVWPKKSTYPKELNKAKDNHFLKLKL